MLTCNNILKFETFVDTLQTFVKKVAFYDVIPFICVKEIKIKNGNSKIGKIILKFKLLVYWYISRIINFRFVSYLFKFTKISIIQFITACVTNF